MAFDASNLGGMTADELTRARDELLVDIRGLLYDEQGQTRTMTAEQETGYQGKLRLLDQVEGHLKVRQAFDRGTTERPFSGPQFMARTAPWDGQDVTRMADQQARSLALRALDTRYGSEHLTDAQRERVAELIRADDPYLNGAAIARRTILTENEHYRAAWSQVMTSPHPLLNQEEVSALRAYKDFERSESRSMSEGTTTAGGYGVPVFIDPTIVLTGQESENPFRSLAKQVTITTNVWKGVNSAGVTWAFQTEGSVVSDASPTLAQPTATVHMARGFIPYSIEVGQDYPGFAEEMAKLLAAGYMDLEIQKLTSGSGSNEPYGIVTVLSANTNVRVKVTTSGSLGVADIYAAWEALPVRFRQKAATAWLSSTSVQDKIRQFGATYGSNFTVDLTAPILPDLLGAQYRVTDYMAQATTATAANVAVAIVGDWSHFIIARRAGMSIEPIQHLFQQTTAGTGFGKPTGQRGWFAWARLGSTTDTDLAFRMLTNVT